MQTFKDLVKLNKSKAKVKTTKRLMKVMDLQIKLLMGIMKLAMIWSNLGMAELGDKTNKYLAVIFAQEP